MTEAEITADLEAEGVAAAVEATYRAALGRAPDPEGFDFWVGAVGDLTIRQAVRVFLDSPEGRARIAALMAGPEPIQIAPQPVKHPQQAEPEKLEVLDGVGAIFRWSIWTPVLSVTASRDRFRSVLSKPSARAFRKTERCSEADDLSL